MNDLIEYPSLAEEKWVRIMADFAAEGVWNKDGAGESIDQLPITQTLRDRAMAWQRWYEQCDDYFPPEARDDPARKFDTKAFSQEGFQIAQAIKLELPDWTVVYFDETKCRYGNGAPQERFEFEYEITTPMAANSPTPTATSSASTSGER